jgi:hypothetical protein
MRHNLSETKNPSICNGDLPWKEDEDHAEDEECLSKLLLLPPLQEVGEQNRLQGRACKSMKTRFMFLVRAIEAKTHHNLDRAKRAQLITQKKPGAVPKNDTHRSNEFLSSNSYRQFSPSRVSHFAHNLETGSQPTFCEVQLVSNKFGVLLNHSLCSSPN